MKNKEKKTLFVSVSELAKILGISRVAVFKKIKKGQIPASKVGRSYVILKEDVDSVIHGKPLALTEEKKGQIKKAVEKVVREYGETLKLIGKE